MAILDLLSGVNVTKYFYFCVQTAYKYGTAETRAFTEAKK